MAYRKKIKKGTSIQGDIQGTSIYYCHAGSGVAYPDNSSYSFAYTADGLMTDEFDPQGNNFQHQYDTGGKIAAVLDPEGGSWSYARSVDEAGYATTTILTAEGNLTKYVDHAD